MSRFIDELHRIDRITSQPMGFQRAHKPLSEPRLLLIASLELGDAGKLADRIDGANAVLFHPGKATPTATAVQSAGKSLPDIPWGINTEDISASKVAPLIKGDCDFVVFPAAGLVSTMPEDDKIGKIMQVESSLDDGLLRAVNDLPVDAVLITDTLDSSGPLIWHQLMIFQHLTNLLTKPVIVPITAKVTENELKALWEAGVDSVVVEADIKKPEGLKELRRLIDELPARSLPKRGKTEALLPYSSAAKDTETYEEEEEEYE